MPRCIINARMGQQSRTRLKVRPAGRLLWLALAAALAFAIGSAVRAQETPEPTPAETPQETFARIKIQAPVEPITVGDEFNVLVLVENVEHLAAFDFAIAYDPTRLQPVDAADDADSDDPPPDRFEVRGDAGEFLATGERGENMTCDGPYVSEDAGDKVFVSCVTLGPPICLEGLPGADGSGLLGRMRFRAEAAGETTLELIDPTSLILDDVQPCDPAENPRAIEILHRRENATVEVQGNSGFPWLIVGPIVGVVLVVLVGGGAAWFLRNGRRRVAAPP